MAEIISFPQRMHFTALRTYDTATGIGGVVAVLWAPVNARSNRNGQNQKSGGHPALAELCPETTQPIVAVPSNPAMTHDCNCESRITHGHR
ncbi:hypothetical protein [Stenotrophomonas sp.]|uniref:hypothetical protein n=1 Tax=Stenotrophomonas sp. TaxID=69392 RepID=UPI002D6614C0|nr:hypothetical protein [Stenotrophomonas sp.]HYQ23963.1 hypothetical protein [Stenotrophomonas sp.]